MQIKNLLTYLTALLLLTSCSQNNIPKWLVGEWVFDTEATLENIKSNTPEKPQPADIFSGLQALVLPMLAGMELTISQRDIITSFQGQKKLKEIKIYKSDSHKVTLIQPDGILTEYHKSPNGFWTTSDDGKLKIFFKKK